MGLLYACRKLFGAPVRVVEGAGEMRIWTFIVHIVPLGMKTSSSLIHRCWGKRPGADLVSFIVSVRRFRYMALFDRYVGIDYSGAETADSSLSSLRVYVSSPSNPPQEELPPPSPRKYWTRRGIAQWLCTELSKDIPALVGIDHGFSFPLAYFDRHSLKHNWSEFLDDFQRHWPTDDRVTCVDFIRDGACGKGDLRSGDPSWLRLTEQWTATAKSARESARPVTVDKFDADADIEVVGSGAGGMTAALFGRWLGNDVVLLEKASELGGTSRKSAYWSWIPNNEPMRAMGIQDPLDGFLRLVARLSRSIQYDPSSPTLGLTEWEVALASACHRSSEIVVF